MLDHDPRQQKQHITQALRLQTFHFAPFSRSSLLPQDLQGRLWDAVLDNNIQAAEAALDAGATLTGPDGSFEANAMRYAHINARQSMSALSFVEFKFNLALTDSWLGPHMLSLDGLLSASLAVFILLFTLTLILLFTLTLKVCVRPMQAAPNSDRYKIFYRRYLYNRVPRTLFTPSWSVESS